MASPSMLPRVVGALALAVAPAAQAGGAPVSLGPVTGDVSTRGAVVWARAPGPGTLHVQVSPRVWSHALGWDVLVGPDSDYTGQVVLDGLTPGRAYEVRVRYTDTRGREGPYATGRFQTAPPIDAVTPVSFVFGGDVGGQGRCRRLAADGTELGYPIFSAMNHLNTDFFIMNGDQIYADGTCPADGPAEAEIQPWRNVPGPMVNIADPAVSWQDSLALRSAYWEHWRYNRADAAYQAFLAGVPMYVQWDDHEVINDFGAAWPFWSPSSVDRAGYPNLVAVGRQAFAQYNPLGPIVAERGGLYRSFRWGQDLELFLLDARTWRSPNATPDTPEKPKTLLGPAQLAWLERVVADSTATWKVISVDVPLAIATGSRPERNGRDAWANGAGAEPADQFEEHTGFERELTELLSAFERAGIQNLVFLSTDVHYAQIARFSPDLDGDGTPLVFHEIIAGPLSAWCGRPQPPDPTFAPEILWQEGGIFNYGLVRVSRPDGVPTLSVEIRGEDGAVRPGGTLTLTAR